MCGHYLQIKEDDYYENVICREWKIRDNNYTALIGSMYEGEREFEDVQRIIIGVCGKSVPLPSSASLESSINQFNALVFQQRTCEEAWDENLQ